MILSHAPPCSCKSKEKEKEKKRNINNDLAILPSHDNDEWSSHLIVNKDSKTHRIKPVLSSETT